MTGRRREPVVLANEPVEPSTIDLHTHTVRSDGVLEPSALVIVVAATGVRLLAITDHDDVSAYRELHMSGAALPRGLELIPGVEINCLAGARAERWDGEIHVLGLGVDPDDDAFEAVLVEQRANRRIRFERTLERLRELELPVDDLAAELDPGRTASLGRPTLARFMMAKGWVSSVEEGFSRYLARGRPAYVPREGIGPAEAIRAIRAAGGLPALAHFGEAAERRDLIADLQTLGLGGLEVYYRAFDPPTVERLATVAQALGLVPTGGSDYHGDTGPYADYHAGLRVPPEVADRVHAALTAAHRTEMSSPR